MKKINCFIPYQDPDSVVQTIASLRESNLTGTIYLLYTHEKPQVAGCETIQVDNMQSTRMVRQIAERATGNYTLIYTKSTPLQLGQFALERLLHAADDSGAGLVYADYYQLIDGERKALPVIDYQQGSVRDDFNFGSVQFYCSKALREAVGGMQTDYEFAGLYNLRLKVSQRHAIFHLNEFLYTEIEDDKRKSGEKQFDYVDPKNRAVQLEMEQACTRHMKQIGVRRAAPLR